MKKKLLITVFILIGCFIVYKISNQIYSNYKFKQFEDEYSLNTHKLKNLVFSSAEKDIKFNDLIFVCELRKGLWETGVGVDRIEMAAEVNSERYKGFVNKVKKTIDSDAALKGFIGNNETEVNTQIIATLCTLKDPETQTSRSLYNDLLWKKYKETGDSLGGVNKEDISEEDISEYQKAKNAEKELRMQF